MDKVNSNVVEGNKLIAEFMGIDVYDTYEKVQLVPIDKLNRYFLSGQGKYHSSWDWLMPVFIKIGVTYKWQIETMGCTIYSEHPILFGYDSTEGIKEDSLKHCCWLAVVEFIKRDREQWLIQANEYHKKMAEDAIQEQWRLIKELEQLKKDFMQVQGDLQKNDL